MLSAKRTANEIAWAIRLLEVYSPKEAAEIRRDYEKSFWIVQLVCDGLVTVSKDSPGYGLMQDLQYSITAAYKRVSEAPL